MDNRTSNNDDNKWVEESIARLSPPSGWRPDANQAFERMMRQRRTPASISPVLRLSLAGAMIVAIALIVTLLPWQTLWAPKSDEKAVSTETLAEHVEPATPPVEALTIPQSQQAPSTTQTTRNNSKDLPSEQTKQRSTSSSGVTSAGTEAQTASEAAVLRTKKSYSTPFASLQEHETVPELTLSALQGTQGQNSPSDTGVTPPRLVSRVSVEYTPEAREAKVTGTLEVLITVREDGTVKFDRITKSLGYGLDEAAAAAVEQFTFLPGRKDGKPVAVTTTLLFNFSLR